MSEATDCTGAWAEYRRLLRVYAFTLLGFVPFCLTVAYLSLKFFGTPVVGFVIGIVWMGAFLLLSFRFFNWPCPRCGGRFRPIWLFPAKHCCHCGLRRWAAN